MTGRGATNGKTMLDESWTYCPSASISTDWRSIQRRAVYSRSGNLPRSKEVRRGDSTFDFLGFTHYWARTRRGYWVVKRKTARKKVRKTVQALWDWCKKNRHMDLEKQHRILCSKLRGHFQYFGVRCNMRAMEAILHHAKRGWKFWLNRRSSKKALNWEKYEAYCWKACRCRRPRLSIVCLNACWVAKLCVRAGVDTLITEEPDDRIGHVRICGDYVHNTHHSMSLKSKGLLS